MNLNLKKLLLLIILFLIIFLIVKLNKKQIKKISKLNSNSINNSQKKIVNNKNIVHKKIINNKIIKNKFIEQKTKMNNIPKDNIVQIESTLTNDSGVNSLVNYEINNPELKLNKNKFINFDKYKQFDNNEDLININLENKNSKCQILDITQNKNFNFQMNDNLLLPTEDNILHTYLYRVTKYFTKGNEKINEKICFKKKATHGYYIYNWLNKSIKKFNIDLIKYISYNVARFTGNFSNLMRINNIPRGNLINFYKSNMKFKSIFISKNRDSINLNKLNINTNGLDMIEIKSINIDSSNDKDYFYNHIIFKNTPILFISNTKLNNVYDILEGNENTIIYLYNGNEIINTDNRKFNVYNVPFDCSINLDDRYNLYSDNNNKKSIIYNLGQMELYLNSKLRVINKKNFVGMNCNIDDIPY